MRRIAWLAWAVACVAAIIVSVALAAPPGGTGTAARAATVPSGSSSGHGHAHGTFRPGRRISCGDNTGRWQVNEGQWRWATEWTGFNYDACYQRSSLECRSRIGTTTWVHGGWVYSVNLWSGVNCPNSYPTAVQGGYNYAKQAGAPYAYQPEHNF